VAVLSPPSRKRAPGPGVHWRNGHVQCRSMGYTKSENGLVAEESLALTEVLRTFNDPKVAMSAGTECLKSLPIDFAVTSRKRGLVGVEFDKDRPQR
jgi:hypothetical protein